MKLHNYYFSARGTTETCARLIARELTDDVLSQNWAEKCCTRTSCTDSSCTKTMSIPADEVLLLSMPVYAGYIPKMCVDMVTTLQGTATPAIIVAVYGNRHYDNALIQMRDMLSRQGFVVVAAGAFVAEHSIFPTVAAGRPDAQDKKAMIGFAAQCRALLQKDLSGCTSLTVPGDPAWNADITIKLPFTPDATEDCTDCGACAEVCPTGAIDTDNVRITNDSLCTWCGACISICPTKARDYHSDIYTQAKAQFEQKCAAYRTPETFFLSK